MERNKPRDPPQAPSLSIRVAIIRPPSSHHQGPRYPGQDRREMDWPRQQPFLQSQPVSNVGPELLLLFKYPERKVMIKGRAECSFGVVSSPQQQHLVEMQGCLFSISPLTLSSPPPIINASLLPYSPVGSFSRLRCLPSLTFQHTEQVNVTCRGSANQETGHRPQQLRFRFWHFILHEGSTGRSPSVATAC